MLSQRGQCSGAAKDAGNTDGHDGDKNDHIHKAVVSDQASIKRGKHKWRGAVSIRVSGIQQTIVDRADKKADEGETEDVEPEKVST